MPITYKSVAASDLRAPDISKAGDLFDKAIGSFKSAGKGVQADRTAVAQGEANLQTADILEQIQGATNLGDAARLREQFSVGNRDQNLLLDNEAITAGLIGLEDTIASNRRRREDTELERIQGVLAGPAAATAGMTDKVLEQETRNAQLEQQLAGVDLGQTAPQREAFLTKAAAQLGGGSKADVVDARVSKYLATVPAGQIDSPSTRSAVAKITGDATTAATIVEQHLINTKGATQVALDRELAAKAAEASLDQAIDRNRPITLEEGEAFATSAVVNDWINLLGPNEQQKAKYGAGFLVPLGLQYDIPAYMMVQMLHDGKDASGNFNFKNMLDGTERRIKAYNKANPTRTIPIASTMGAMKTYAGEYNIPEKKPSFAERDSPQVVIDAPENSRKRREDIVNWLKDFHAKRTPNYTK